ncbi:hypothetical protein PINS_up013213 [Pythium insidiosum]|nr:hypothetical protein PINS_up013213 [Pythium insidiosum]
MTGIKKETTTSRVKLPRSRVLGRTDRLRDADSTGRQGLWTPDEHERYLRAIKELRGRPWKEIAQRIGTRTARQVRTHHQKYMRKVKLRVVRGTTEPYARQEHRVDAALFSFCGRSEAHDDSKQAFELQSRLDTDDWAKTLASTGTRDAINAFLDSIPYDDELATLDIQLDAIVTKDVMEQLWKAFACGGSSNQTATTELPASLLMATSLNVRELLELERNLYQESIDRNGRQHDALLNGTLEDYVLKCLPFEQDRERELEAASVHLQLNKRNAADLLDVELKQADDMYKEQRRVLKNELLAAALERQRAIRKRLRAIETAPEELATPDVPRVEEPVVLREDGTIDTSVLEAALRDSQVANQAAFNLRHLQYNIPPPPHIVRDVMNEVRSLHDVWNTKQRNKDAQAHLAVSENSVDSGKVLKIGEKVFRAEEYVILWSAVSEEEFFGQVKQITSDKVEFLLLCGSHIVVQLAALRDGSCTLRHQPPPQQFSVGTEDRRPVTPRDRRKRHRRKHTLGPLQKF